jgi:Flp pilus assembly protein TadG
LKRRIQRYFRRSEDAQGVIEFALILTALMLLFLGTVDFSRFLYYDTAISNATRIGAEAASNHCYVHAICGNTGSVTTDNDIMWATFCEAKPYDQLSPTFSSCDQNAANFDTCTSAGVNGCASCLHDICVLPSDATRQSGDTVTVSVGYKFNPISFAMKAFFGTKTCWSGDSLDNGHTLCVSSVGRAAS